MYYRVHVYVYMYIVILIREYRNGKPIRVLFPSISPTPGACSLNRYTRLVRTSGVANDFTLDAKTTTKPPPMLTH